MTTATVQENQLLRQFKDQVPYRPQCPECEAKMYRKAVENTLKENSVLKDAENVSELTLIECPECGETIDIMESGRK